MNLKVVSLRKQWRSSRASRHFSLLTCASGFVCDLPLWQAYNGLPLLLTDTNFPWSRRAITQDCHGGIHSKLSGLRPHPVSSKRSQQDSHEYGISKIITMLSCPRCFSKVYSTPCREICLHGLGLYSAPFHKWRRMVHPITNVLQHFRHGQSIEQALMRFTTHKQGPPLLLPARSAVYCPASIFR